VNHARSQPSRCRKCLSQARPSDMDAMMPKQENDDEDDDDEPNKAVTAAAIISAAITPIASATSAKEENQYDY
jgi:hypothetical protein